jgi:hypothetical protein
MTLTDRVRVPAQTADIKRRALESLPAQNVILCDSGRTRQITAFFASLGIKSCRSSATLRRASEQAHGIFAQWETPATDFKFLSLRAAKRSQSGRPIISSIDHPPVCVGLSDKI